MTNIIEATRKYRITAILRGIDNTRIFPVIDALYEGGIRLLEITFNQNSQTKLQDTAKAIHYAKNKYGTDMYVGAGTVMSEEEVAVACEAGAEFILSPNTNEKVIRCAIQHNICAIPGAMTPSEVSLAYEAGAQIVKLFPAGNLGLDYCKAIMAPLNHVPLIAVGGVNDQNLPDFLKAGFIGAGIGSNLTNKKMIENKDFEGLKRLAAVYMAAARK